MALLTVPSVHAQQPQTSWQPKPFRSLLIADHVSEEITGIDVMEIGMDGVPRYLSVGLQGHVGTVGQLAKMNIQVWLLRVDGTTVAQRETFPCYDCFESIPPTDYRRFTFAPIPAKELAGVVVSVNGNMYVREINAGS